MISENHPKSKYTKFGSEKYLNLLPKKFKTIFIKYKNANHHLPIETGRRCGIPKLERTNS